MTLRITPAAIESDGHVVLLPAGLTGEVEVDGVAYDLSGRQAVVNGVVVGVVVADTQEHAAELTLEASRRALESEDVPQVTEFDEEQSRKNLRLPKKKRGR